MSSADERLYQRFPTPDAPHQTNTVEAAPGWVLKPGASPTSTDPDDWTFDDSMMNVDMDPRFRDPPFVGQDPHAQLTHGRDIVIARNTAAIGTMKYDGIANQIVNAVWTPLEKDAVPYTITISVTNPPVNDSNFPEGIFAARITWMIGGTQYSKTINMVGFGMAGAYIRRIPIIARKVLVDVLWQTDTGVPLSSEFVTFTIACEKKEINSPLFLAPTWYAGAMNDGAAANAYYMGPQGTIGPPILPYAPGVVLGCTGFLTATNPSEGAPYYVAMIFDLPSLAALVAGQAPIPGGVSPPLVNVGDAFSFSEEFDPQIGFLSGVVIALSTDPFVYSPPSTGEGAAAFRVDAKIGQ